MAVMGENLILNMANHGFTVACYNRTTSVVDKFIAGRAQGKSIIGVHSPEELAKVLKAPRKVMIMVRAGGPVDDTIAKIVPFLEKGDIIIDGGNSNYEDTNRRINELTAKGLHFFGTGISGGEEGALMGPSIMPGGSEEAWKHLKPIFQTICAKVDNAPCCDYVGQAGSGHFVKMVHNGIEYGDMQLITEAYGILKNLVGLSNGEIAATLAEWNQGDLDSYLIEISRDIFLKKDELTNGDLIDVILDAAGQKGTGKWTVINGLELGAPVTLIAEAVFARTLSSLKNDRVLASSVLEGPVPAPIKFESEEKRKEFIEDLRQAVYASKIVSYAQGFVLMREAAKAFKWTLNYGAIALMWRGGCIIRSKFLGKIKEAFDKNHDLSNLLLDDFFKEKIHAAQGGWRRVVSAAVLSGTYIPAFSCALNYFDGLRTARLQANLIQAQRDYFGAHTYERTDKPRGETFHTNWTGRGGTTSASTYNT
uniref:6-phosphogluconate dehydrogenase, decarboxylating n=1 Tax=Arcella intermedia TaxID=1963864 RepID=A0A6B2L2M1_9EUKA